MAGKARVKGLIFMILCLFLEGCAGKNPGIEKEREGGPLKVVVTLFPYYDFTRQIAGDMVDLELIVPAGMDSHLQHDRSGHDGLCGCSGGRDRGGHGRGDP